MPAMFSVPPAARRPHIGRLSWRLLALPVVVVLSACGGSTQSTGPTPAAKNAGLKVYHHSMDEAPSSLDPVHAANIYANHILENTLDTLYAYKYLARPYELKPNLADGWPTISADRLTYTFRIKRGVRFQDDPAFPGGQGREVVAADFVYSLKRNFDPKTRPQGAWFWQGRIVGLDAWKEAGSDYDVEVPGLRALDRYTIEVRLTGPYPQLLDTFAQGYSGVVPREAVQYYGREFGVHPVGSGPFKLVAYDSARAVLERNPHFRQEPVDLAAEGYDPATQRFSGVERIQGRSPPFVDRVIFEFARDDTSRWNSFIKGDEIQYTSIPNEKIETVLESRRPVRLLPEYARKYQMYTGLEAGFVFEVFNFADPRFGYHPDPVQDRRNKALRCAIMKAWDWPARNESWYYGIARVFPGIIVPVVPEFDPATPTDTITRDVPAARRLLAENGWTADNLPVIVYGQAAGVKQRMFYEQFRAWLVDIGYPAEKIKAKYYATFGDISRAWKESQLPIVSKGWGLDFPDAENTLQLFYGPNGSPGSNDANYKNSEFDRLYEEAASLLPGPERTALYRRMNEILLGDCVGMTGLSRNRIYLWHQNVVGLPDREITGGFWIRFVDVLPPGESARPADLATGT
jgi:ABC-type transport system substrate-binding protein